MPKGNQGTRPAKVPPAEYSDADAADTESPEWSDLSGWEVGQPAPATKYIDHDSGAITDDQPARAKVLVFEGAVVTPRILEILKGG